VHGCAAPRPLRPTAPAPRLRRMGTTGWWRTNRRPYIRGDHHDQPQEGQHLVRTRQGARRLAGWLARLPRCASGLGLGFPPCGGTLNVDALQIRLRAGCRVPLDIRFVTQGICRHGFWLVAPAGPPNYGDDPFVGRLPCRPIVPGARSRSATAR